MSARQLPDLDVKTLYDAWRSHALWNEVHPVPPTWEGLCGPLRGSWACLSRTVDDYHQREMAALALMVSRPPRRPWWKLW